MTRILFLLLALTLLCNMASAQEMTYFPCAVGNTWVYQYDDGRIERKEITKDSTDNNGNLFLRINEGDPGFDMWTYMMSSNIDSIFFWPNSINELVYRFPITGASDHWFVVPPDNIYGWPTEKAIVGGVGSAEVLGFKTSTITISYHVLSRYDTTLSFRTWEKDQIIAKGFGLIGEGREEGYKRLIGCIINGVKYGTIVGIEKEGKSIPSEFILYQNYPNPFNPLTTISYSIPRQSHVELKVYDMLGHEVSTLVNDQKSAGEYKVRFDGSSLPSGVYIYTIQAGSFRDSKKLLLLK